MRGEWSIPVLLMIPFTALADDMAPESQFVPPPYKVLRFDEDYFCLSNPSTALTGLIQSNTSLCEWVSLPGISTMGGELRERHGFGVQKGSRRR